MERKILKPAGFLTKPKWMITAMIAIVLVWCGVALASTPEENAAGDAQNDDVTSGAMEKLTKNTGLYSFGVGFKELFTSEEAPEITEEPVKKKGFLPNGIGQIVMILVGLLLIYLGVAKQFEPLLLIPIGFGGVLANIPVADIAGPNGFLGIIYGMGIENGLFPLLIFMGVGALTDFGPLIANPKTALLGAAAQFGIFTSLLLALAATMYFPGVFDFNLQDAAAIGIIGGADGPTAIFVSRLLSPRLLGAIAVAAYSYMALVPIIQPPIMRLFTTEAERKRRKVYRIL